MVEDIQIRTLDQMLRRKLQSNSSSDRMIEFSLLTYLKSFFLGSSAKDASRLTDKEPCQIYFNRKKIRLTNVKKIMEEKRAEHKDSFIAFNESKMFEGVIGSVQKDQNSDSLVHVKQDFIPEDEASLSEANQGIFTSSLFNLTFP